MSVHYTPQTKKRPESPTLASMSGGQARGIRLLVCNLPLLLLLLLLVLQPWSDGGCLVGLCLPAWAALTNSLPALLFFCQRRRLSGVPSRHVAVATGVKGRMKEQVPSLFFFFLHPRSFLPSTPTPPIQASFSSSTATSLPGSPGSLASSIYSCICHPFCAASHSGAGRVRAGGAESVSGIWAVDSDVSS